MATMTTSVPAPPVGPLRPVARWVPTIDERGRGRVVMQWHVPDVDEALRSVVADGR